MGLQCAGWPATSSQLVYLQGPGWWPSRVLLPGSIPCRYCVVTLDSLPSRRLDQFMVFPNLVGWPGSWTLQSRLRTTNVTLWCYSSLRESTDRPLRSLLRMPLPGSFKMPRSRSDLPSIRSNLREVCVSKDLLRCYSLGSLFGASSQLSLSPRRLSLTLVSTSPDSFSQHLRTQWLVWGPSRSTRRFSKTC